MSNRNLEVDPKLLEELKLTRAQLGLTGQPCVSEDDVARVREELDLTLSDDLLAVFAMIERDLRQVVVLTEELREEGLPSTLVAIFADPEGFTWCLRKSKGTFTPWPAKKLAPKSLEEIVRRFRITEDEPEEPDFDEEEIDEDLDLGGDDDEERDEDGEDDDEDRADAESAEDLERHAPRRPARPKPIKKPAKKKEPKRAPRPVEDVIPWVVASRREVKWVEHPRFGRGKVVREVKDGRHFLEIAFEDGTTRKLLREFVRDAE
ncbi:MAG: hypothetical protein KF901_19950 [Myxococcales bacterium]|nr:hypothetical protein [Myxococcales bacterium]